MDYTPLINLRISQIPLFKDLPEAEMSKLTAAIRVRKYSEQEAVIRRSEISEYFMIILSGSVEISRTTLDGYKTVFRRLHAPSAIGYSLLAEKYPNCSDIIADEQTLLALIPLGIIQDIFRRNPHLSFNAISHLAQLVNTLSTELMEQRTLSLKERVIRTIKRNCDEHGELLISHEELARMVGATRANVSRALKSLERESKIKLNRKKISLI